MKNRFLLVFCLVLTLMFAFASCEEAPSNVGGNNNNGGTTPSTGDNGGATTETCEHTFSENWSTNETHHWHAATCEHGENRDSYAEHVDADEDGACDSCAYEVGHDHTFASEWTFDTTNHWKVATCTHVNEMSELGLHVDENSDASCDFCGTHVHVLSTSGMCLSCKEQIKVIDTSNIASVVASISDRYSLVNGGKIVSERISRNGRTNQTSSFAEITEYSLGNNSIYYKIASAAAVNSTDREGVEYQANTESLLEKWQNLEANGEVFGVYRETVEGVAGEIQEDSATIDSLYGYYYSVSTLASRYGAEGILAAMYEKSQADGSSDFYFEHEEGTREYKFGFNFFIVNSMKVSDTNGDSLGMVYNANYFVATVEFAYDNDYALTNLKITCDCYTSDGGSILKDGVSVLDEKNVDLTYDPTTGTFELLEGAKADTYTFIVEQTVGERTFVNEYTKEAFAPKGFLVYADDTFDSEKLCPDTVTVSLSGDDKYARFYLADQNGQKFTSTTAEALEWTTSDESGLSCQFAIGSAFSFATSHVKFLAKAVGTYTVTISYQGVTRTFTVVVVD